MTTLFELGNVSAGRRRSWSAENPVAIIFRTFEQYNFGVAIVMAACVMSCGGCVVATLATKDAEAVKSTCENLHCLWPASKC